MIDGSGSDDFRHAKTMMFSRPDLLEHILEINVQSVAAYLIEQVKAGAQALMIFDTWGGLLPDGWYQRMSLVAMQKVIALLPREHEGRKIPIIMFTKGGGIWLNDMAQIGADVIAVDWTVRLSHARKQLLGINKPLALQGNLDPLILFAEPEQIATAASVLLDDLASAPALSSGLHPLDGHIFNLGHGINQFTPPESVAALSETVISKSKALRAA
jgi:uroporphyrinogen decarboxylase